MIGNVLLAGAGFCALVSAVTAAAGIGQQKRLDRYLLQAGLVLLWGAVVTLGVVIMQLDTSYAYVAEQTRPGLNPAMRFSALWSGAEGSLLLFAGLLAGALLIGHRDGPRWQRTGVGLVTAAIVLTSFEAANPFQRLELPPLAGAGMAPILEHYAMVIHPPLLYVGMVLALTPALVRDHRLAHRLGLFSLAVLTLALGLGSVWAYVELGWGGWWAWDPIENVALIIWLLLAGAMHWLPMGRHRHGADSPTVGSGSLGAVTLWALCWPAVLGGAALTRTSLRTSVHAFADAAGLAAWLWPLVIIATIGAGLRILESDRSAGAGPSNGARGLDGGSPRWWTGREMMERWPQLVVVTAAVIIAAGTYRPFVPGDGTAGFFYSRTLFPVVIVGALLLAVVPLWRPGQRPQATIAMTAQWGLWSAALLTLLVTLAGWRLWYQLVLAVVVGFAVGPVVASSRQNTARFSGHLGLLLILFAALAGTASTESSIRLRVGQVGEVDGHRVELVSVDVVSEQPLQARAVVLIDDTNRLEPSVTVYPERSLRLPEVATSTVPWLDTQAVLRDVDEAEGALITVLFRPWNQLVWWGVGLLAGAALLLAVDLGRVGRRQLQKQTSPG